MGEGTGVNLDVRFELLDKIGSGSYATVYRARDKELGREVAVKQIHALKRQLFSRGDDDQALSTDEKTLAAFVKADHLQQLPVQPAKLIVVLNWLVQRFQLGQEYPERTVNEMLTGHAVDYATLRRLLIDYGLLTRTAGIYRRVEDA